MALNLAENIQASRARRESDFFNNLLAYGMQSGGEFEIVDGTPTFVPGGDMPDKSAMWNEFLRSKGGRLTQADIQQFEMAWKQANQMKTTNQLSQLTKLRNRGYSPDEIKGAIEDSPELYGNLLDLVGDLEAASMGGDENAFAQAQTIKQMMPERDTGGLLGGLIDDPGMFAPLALAGGAGLTQYLAATPEEFAKARAERASQLSKTRTEKRKLNTKISNAEKLLRKKPANQTARDILAKSKSRLADINKELKELKPLSKGEARYKSYMKKIPKGAKGLPTQILGYSALAQAGDIGEYLGGDVGRDVAETAGGLTFAGMAAKKGTGLLGKLGAFGAKAAARHAAVTGASAIGGPAAPVLATLGNIGALGLDAYLAYQMLMGDE